MLFPGLEKNLGLRALRCQMRSPITSRVRSHIQGFPSAAVVKNLPAMQETQVRSLGGKDPLEKGMATHCSVVAWRIPWTEKPSRLQSMGSQTS